MSDAHVIPLGDLIEHAATDDCVCVPTDRPVELPDGAVGPYATGGVIPSYEPTDDEVPALLSPCVYFLAPLPDDGHEPDREAP